MADQSKYEDILNDLVVIRDETSMHANTATRVGEAMIKLLHFTEDRAKEIEEEIGQGHGGDSYWEEYKDPESGKVSVKLKDAYAGAWANGFISSLGMSDMGSSLLLGEFLTALNEADLAAHPDAAGKTVVWNGTAWVFGTAGSGTDMNDVWTALAGNTTEQINGTHLSNALNAYATKSWVEDQGYLTNESYRGTVTSVATGTGLTGGTITSSGTISINSTYQNYISHGQTAYGWGNHANAGYLTSSDIQDMATKTWVTNTANAASATKLQTARMLWGNNFNGTQSIGTPESWAPLNWVTNIVMKGNLDWRYGGADSMTSRILEYESGRLSVNDCAFHFRSIKSANSSTFPGGALDVTTDWGGYSFRNVLTGNSLFENTLFLRQGLYMKNGFPIFMKNNAGANVSTLVMESDNLVLGSGAYTNAGISTYIRGNYVIFQIANGANAATQVGHFDNSGNFCIDVAGKSLFMNDGTTTRNMLGINTPATHFHVCYGAVGADWQTRIYGGATTGIKFYCGSTEVASVYRNVDSNQNVYQGIRIGNALLSWDSTNNALKVQRYDGAAVNFYSLGGVSALGFTAPQSSLDAFRIDYLTSTNISTQTVDVATQMNLGSANCNIKVNSSSLTINAPAGLTLVTNSGYGLRASRFYLDATRYIYLDGTTLKYYNGSQSKTIS